MFFEAQLRMSMNARRQGHELGIELIHSGVDGGASERHFETIASTDSAASNGCRNANTARLASTIALALSAQVVEKYISKSRLWAAVRFALCSVPFASNALGQAVPNEIPIQPASQLPAGSGARVCPPEMAPVGTFCIDRWEVSTVDKSTQQPLSPYYPPSRQLLVRVWELWQNERRLLGELGAPYMPLPDLPAWQRVNDFEARAAARPNVVPQGYMSYVLAKRACANAGKRLCKKEEWIFACKGKKNTRFPYGERYVSGKCNVWRHYHPAFVLHGASWLGHTDPRLNLVFERGTDPVLRPTGTTEGCVSRFGDQLIYDMVGNLDEWIEDETGVFVGGFYARATTQGCEAEVTSHAPIYYDYSTGTRCCL
jgi:hypothetical protein